MKSIEERIRDLDVRIGDIEHLIFMIAPCPECGNTARRIENRRIVCEVCEKGIASEDLDLDMDGSDPE